MDISATGVLFYKNIDGFINILLVNNFDNYYEDIGGEIIVQDKSIYDTVIRIIGEKTNYLISDSYMMNLLKKEQLRTFYIEHSKYLLYIIEASEYIKKLDSFNFGTVELCSGCERTIEWIPREEFFGKNVKYYLENLK